MPISQGNLTKVQASFSVESLSWASKFDQLIELMNQLSLTKITIKTTGGFLNYQIATVGIMAEGHFRPTSGTIFNHRLYFVGGAIILLKTLEFKILSS
jgi:hypothetical protein